MKRFLIYIILISFGLNLVWENTQAPLYEGYQNFWAHFPICSLMTLGDAALVVLFYLILAVFYKNWRWPESLNWHNGLTLVMIGTVTALFIEKAAIGLGIWQYAPSMPILPFVGAGLTPTLQMALLPLITFHLVKKMEPPFGAEPLSFYHDRGKMKVPKAGKI